jgi:hypothetical protein
LTIVPGDADGRHAVTHVGPTDVVAGKVTRKQPWRTLVGGGEHVRTVSDESCDQFSDRLGQDDRVIAEA